MPELPEVETVRRGLQPHLEGERILRAEASVRRGWPSQVLVLSREASPWSLGEVEETLLHRAERGVYDVDDAIFADRSPIRRAMRIDRKWARMVGAADVVVVGNDHLAEHAAPFARDLRIIQEGQTA